MRSVFLAILTISIAISLAIKDEIDREYLRYRFSVFVTWKYRVDRPCSTEDGPVCVAAVSPKKTLGQWKGRGGTEGEKLQAWQDEEEMKDMKFTNSYFTKVVETINNYI